MLIGTCLFIQNKEQKCRTIAWIKTQIRIGGKKIKLVNINIMHVHMKIMKILLIDIDRYINTNVAYIRSCVV